MSSISTIVSDLRYGRAKLLQAIEGLSQRELTKIPIQEEWTIKEVLAHILGWDQRVLQTLPLMLQNRASEVAGVEVDKYNQASITAWHDKSLAEIIAQLQATHRQILDIIGAFDHKEIDTRRERNGRIITIRSYVVDVMLEHDREHAAEIELWRKNLEQRVDPKAIKAVLSKNRADFKAIITGLSQADLLDKRAVGVWSVKDVLGHVTDWERLMLDAALHIHDRSLPPVGVVTDDANERLAARRETESWDQVWHDFIEVSGAVDHFVAKLKKGDWTLRGPYPWPDDQGALAELIDHIATHYTDHWPDLQSWRTQKIKG